MEKRGPSPLIGLLLVGIAAVLLSAGCDGPAVRPDAETLQSLGFRPLPDGSAVPDIELTSLHGDTPSLSDYRGSVLLLNFWATWCPPCRAEIPSMNILDAELQGGDFELIAVNVQEPRELVEGFIDEFDVRFPVFLDEDAAIARTIGVTGLPTSIIVDRDGNAVAVVSGALEWNDEAVVAMMKDWTR